MASPWDVHVDVTLESDNPIAFRLGSKDLPKGGNGDFIFNNDGHPGFHIHFTLIDQTNKGYLWPTNSKKDEAVWSELGSGVCPQPPGKADVFHALSVDKARTTLVVNNPNPKPAQGPFGYTLRVTNDPNEVVFLPLDPGGINNNGATSRWNMMTTVVVAVAVVAVAAVALYEVGAFT